MIPESKKYLQVIEFIVVKEVENLNGSSIFFYLTVKLKTEMDCVETERGEALFYLEMPKDYVSAKKYQGYYHFYDTTSVNSIQINRVYFGLLDCNRPSKLSYIEESSYIAE